jgi:hypothetical protein
MEIEFELKIMKIDEGLQEKIQTMLQEGWQVSPGHHAVAIYPVQRAKSTQAPQGLMGAASTLGIDETKIKILRDGKLIDG